MHRTLRPLTRAAWAFLALIVASAPAAAQSPAGMWDATVTVNNVDIPFRFEIAGNGNAVKGFFFNGDEKMASTGGHFTNGELQLNFDQLGTRIDATVANGRLDGKYVRGTRTPFPLKAVRFTPPPPVTGQVPAVGGLWTMPTASNKGEAAWRLIVRQSGPDVSAAILRVDGDTGTLSGRYKNGTFVLSHFAGSRPLLLEITPQKDGTLQIVQNHDQAKKMTATRADKAKAEGLPEPADPSRFSRVKDPTEPFRFSFPDLAGRTVANTDPKFRGKVVIVSITGSWCPNCHDEAPFLSELYRKYHDKGLEIVAFAFEEDDQLKNPTRLRAFLKQYNIDYTVLLCGEPSQLGEKVPQIANLSTFPASIFIGRDGLVRGVHAGFAGKASGSFYAQTTEDITSEVRKLLGERVAPTR